MIATGGVRPVVARSWLVARLQGSMVGAQQRQTGLQRSPLTAFVPTSEDGKIGLSRRTAMRTRDLRGMISDSSDPSASDPTTEHAALQPFQAEKRLTKCLCGLTRATAGKPAVVCAYRGNKNMRVCRSFTGATGLEPATSGVTGRRSNQLNYAPGTGKSSGIAARSSRPRGLTHLGLAPPAADGQPRPVAAMRSATILVLERNVAVQELIEQVLRDAGHRVLCTNDAGEALDVMRRVQVDVFVAGGLVGRLDSLVAELRAIQDGLPVMVVSGRHSLDGRRRTSSTTTVACAGRTQLRGSSSVTCAAAWTRACSRQATSRGLVTRTRASRTAPRAPSSRPL